MPDGSGLFGYAILGRTGMGNMMFPWARCFVWCKDTGASMIAPSWMHLRIGPYLRREPDKRDYYRLWSGRGYVRGPRRLAAFAMRSRIEERDVTDVRSIPRGSLVVFRDMPDYFARLRGRHMEVEKEMRRIAKVQLPPVPSSARAAIGIHVRRGDFSRPPSVESLGTLGHNWQLPIEWYVQTLRQVRAACGERLPGKIFSDGTPEELAPLMREPDTSLVKQGKATHDMLLLSQCSVIIASGSTFSMWASFLGQRPAVWFPGQLRQRVLGMDGDADAEVEVALGESLPSRFAARLHRTLVA